MFRISSFTLYASKKKGLPSSIASLPMPSLRHKWGNIGCMSADEKRDVVLGEWTRAKPVQLLPDALDRDAGGFADGVHFATDEEAMTFLEEETIDDAAESGIPIMELARGFFDDLAQTADGEVDVENALKVTAASDTEREDEERDVHRNFFADFYEQQGIVSTKNRYQFVDAMLRPPTLMLIVNAGMPFVRLMVRSQLEQHMQDTQAKGKGAVFVPHIYHPLLFTVDLLPTQRIGDPLRVPYTKESSVLAKREAHAVSRPLSCSTDTKQHLLPSHSTNMEELAELQEDLMHALMHDEVGDSLVSHTDEENGSVDPFLTSDGQSGDVALTARLEIPRASLSIGHVYWLQRQVAANTLIDMDPLGVMLPLLLDVHCEDGGIVLDMSSRSGGVQQYSYGKDVAAHLAVAHIGAHNRKKKKGATDREEVKVGDKKKEEEEEDDDMVERVSKAVVISLVSPPLEGHTGENHQRKGSDREVKKRKKKNERGHNANASLEDVPVNDEGDSGAGKFDAQYHFGMESRIVVQGSSLRVWDSLRGACDVVLCCPSTTADGCRPRATLGASGEEEEEAAVNRFVLLCSKVNKLFPYLRRELTHALEYVRTDKGRLVYATQSMNPLENEAVVCSVLTDLKRKYPERLYRPVSLIEGQTEENVEVLQSLMTGGQHGLQTWVALQDGPPEQEVSYNDEGIVAAVASHSWRTDPLSTGSDVSFICVIDIQDAHNSRLPELQPMPLPYRTSEMSNMDPVHSAFPYLDINRLRERWGLVICRSEKDGAFVAVTTEVLKTRSVLCSSARNAGGYGVIDYGARVADSSLCGRRLSPGGSVAVSSSLSGTQLALALSDCVLLEHRPSYLLEIPVLALLELMHAMRLSSFRLRELLEDVPATLSPIEESLSEGTHTVFLKVALPSLGWNSGLNGMELHEAVVSELQKMVVVAQARVVRRSKAKDASFLLTLDCLSVCDRGLLAERVVAISDGLRHLLRRIGSPAPEWPTAKEHGAQQIRMEDDEYEVEFHAPVSADVGDDVRCHLGVRTRRQHEWKMQRLERRLRSLGSTVVDGPANDWEREMHRARTSRGVRR